MGEAAHKHCQGERHANNLGDGGERGRQRGEETGFIIASPPFDVLLSGRCEFWVQKNGKKNI